MADPLEKGYGMSNLRTYADGEPFVGVIDGASDASIPASPTPPRAPDGVPNVVMFVYIESPWRASESSNRR